MASYYSSKLVYFLIYIFNFCERVFNNTIKYVSLKINTQLEGRVLYYAMYTKGSQGQYYTLLYDFTSVFDRLKLILLSFIYNDYFDQNNVFSYNDVQANIENLTSFMIDAVIISYIKDGYLTTKIISYDETENVDTTGVESKFVYALVVTRSGEEHDFTKELNSHIKDIKFSPLNIKDFVHIISVKYRKNLDDMHNMRVKLMMDIDFNESVMYNCNDKFVV
jgi:hypothetical protein